MLNRNFSIISPQCGDVLDLKKYKYLLNQLKYSKHEYIKTRGVWAGDIEESFIIFDLSFQDARNLAIKFKQKAFIHNNTLHYLKDRSCYGMRFKITDIKQSAYTELPDGTYLVGELK